MRFIRRFRSMWTQHRREQTWLSFLKKCSAPMPIAADDKDEIWCVVQPWLATAVPWFVIVTAIGLRQRGRRVRIVYDDTGFGPDSLSQRLEHDSISRALRRIPRSIQQTRLSQVRPAGENRFSESEIQRLTELNGIWRYKCETPPASSATYLVAVQQSLRRTAWHISALVEQYRPEMIFVAGGIYGSSGLFMQLRTIGIPVATFDCGPGLLVICTDGIAAQMSDLPRAFQMLADSEDWIVADAQAELQRRKKGASSVSYQNDTSLYQAVPATGHGERVGILLPLGRSFDTAGLGKHRVFKNQAEWMLETVDWSLKHTRLPIVVRRHPCERIREYASMDDYSGLLERKFGLDPRIEYVSPDDPINTYDLVQRATVVVPCVSTIGTEAAAMGKPVVTEGDSYYADLGFVWSAKTRAEYFALLSLGVEGKLVVSEAQRQAAWRSYYLSQCCHFIYTPFTAIPNDFDRWVKMAPAELLALPEIVDVMDALDNHIPISIVRHMRRSNQREADLSQRAG